MGGTPDKLNNPSSDVPQEIPSAHTPNLDRQKGGAQETTPLSENEGSENTTGRDDEAIRKAREKHAQAERDDRMRAFMQTSKIKQKIVPLNPDEAKPAELPSFLEQPKQPAQNPEPNAIQKFFRRILGMN